jgi:hypothetical protein
MSDWVHQRYDPPRITAAGWLRVLGRGLLKLELDLDEIMAIGEEGARNKQGFQSLDTLVVDLLDPF